MTEDSLPMKELREVFEDLDTLLKNPEVGAALTARGVNLSLAIVAADAVRAYVEGERARAAEDFACVAEEISARLALSAGDEGGTPS